MRLLPLASFIAFMSHLISVSAEYKYICPSQTKFTIDTINNLWENILCNRNIEGVRTFTSYNQTILFFIFENRIIDGVTYSYAIKVFVEAKSVKVYEQNHGNFSFCELVLVADEPPV